MSDEEYKKRFKEITGIPSELERLENEQEEDEPDEENEDEEGWTLAEKLAEHGANPVEVYQAYIDNMGDNVTVDEVDEAYQGKFRSDEEFVEQLVEKLDGHLLKDLPFYIYIDWERTARDVMMDYFEVDGYYFRSL
jgi:antirestriction protein